MMDHDVPVLFQALLPFTSIIELEVGLIPHRGGENDILCSTGTSKFCEHKEIALRSTALQA